MTDHRIIQGDALDALRTLPDRSAQCCITSPPYYQKRDYGIQGQIGLEKTPEAYVQKLVRVFQEVRRVLRPDGTLFLNIGDSYAGSGRGPTGKNGIGDQGKRQGFTDPGVIVPDGMKPKDLMGIPWILAFALRADGWYLRSEIIWSKSNPMPQSVTDRPATSHETIFMLSKSARYYYDVDGIREPAIGGGTRNARTVWTINTQVRADGHYASFPDEIPRRCITTGTSEYGCCPKCGAPYNRIVEKTGGTIGQSWHPHADDEVTGQIGGMPTKGYKREFKGWQPGCKCDAGKPIPCVVIDPFMGSGTVAVVARELNRSSVGIELSPEYVKIIRNRLQVDVRIDTGAITYQFDSVPAQRGECK